ncbi:MAG: 1,2-phenylacetyl-CoA epoxidase subunit B [Methylacidiphilales bacterium]|nr:1,2-phenylacetyl-CoA epoxidase subunit B [Candidatus Methylacidiphilales bacterium]
MKKNIKKKLPVKTKTKKKQSKKNTAIISLFEVFIRQRRGLAHIHVGSVHAHDIDHALTLARDCYLRRGEGLSLWVTPASAIRASTQEEVSSFYEPMQEKDYRKAEYYHIPQEVKHL